MEITSFSTNRWKESGLEQTQYRFIVTNKGNKRITNFRMVIDFNNNINSVTILNYDYTLSSNILTIINNNYVLQPGGQQEVTFTVATSFQNLRIRTIRFVVNEIPTETDPTQFTVLFTKTSESGTYNYQYTGTVTNKTGNRVDYWQLDIILPVGTTFVDGSNATFQASGNTLLVICLGANCRVTNNKSTSFTLQLKTDIINFIPSNIKVTVR
ncbi:MAG: cellulose binding domain-containing protein [Ignavibacteriales bacterium]